MIVAAGIENWAVIADKKRREDQPLR